MKSITFDVFDQASINNAARELNAYAKRLNDKARDIAKELAKIGVTLAAIEYSRVPYHGFKDVNLSIEVGPRPNSYAIVASGETVLILEFGAGIKYGFGHPLEGQLGMGAGTYPGQTHALDRNGWYVPRTREHTYGNPPSMAMYLSAKEIENRVLQVVREVFSRD